MRLRSLDSLLLALAGMGLMGALGCGSEPAPRAKTFSEDAVPDGEDSGGGDDEEDAEDDGEDGADGEGDGDGEDGGEAGDTDLDELFKKCHIDPDQPSKELVNMEFTGLPITKTGTETVLGFPVNYTATITAALAIKSSMLQSVATTNVTASVTPALGQAKADEEAKKKSGPQTTDIMPLDDRVNLGDSAPEWEGIRCSVPAATKVTLATGAGTAVTTFSPALPSSVSPLPEVEIYDDELAEPRTFSGIKATVVQSVDPSVPVGSTHMGTVTVREIAASMTVPQGSNPSVSVGGDRAFEIIANFGSPQITAALGVKPSMRFFIDTTTHTYKAVVVESGEPDVPALVFIRK